VVFQEQLRKTLHGAKRRPHIAKRPDLIIMDVRWLLQKGVIKSG